MICRYGLLVVGHGIVKTTSTLGGGLTRRLLFFGNGSDVPSSLHRDVASFSDWAHVSKPCSTLAAAWMEKDHPMGVVDIDTLEGCVHWRKV